MCCTNTQTPTVPFLQTNSCVGIASVNCGCGCNDKEQTVLHLTHYQEHLKAELKLIEQRINDLQKSSPKHN